MAPTGGQRGRQYQLFNNVNDGLLEFPQLQVAQAHSSSMLRHIQQEQEQTQKTCNTRPNGVDLKQKKKLRSNLESALLRVLFFGLSFWPQFLASVFGLG